MTNQPTPSGETVGEVHDAPGTSSSAEPVPTPAAEVTSAPVRFTGSGGEYFRIWIVNVALTILTLGIYSAWAKVRRLQYFHRHTHVAGASFDYHGDPIVILKGRLAGGALFLLYSTAGYVSPFFALAVLAVVAAVMPWMLARSFRFQLANTSYRGLRFRFTGSVKSACWVFLGLPVLAVFTLGLLGPLWHQRMKHYQYNNSWFGNVAFTSKPATQDFYVAYILAGVVIGGVVSILAAGVVGVIAALAATGNVNADEAPPALLVVAMILAFALYLAGILWLQAFLSARLRNVVWNATTLDTCRFVSRLRTLPLAWILLSNLIATIATLGLFWPFGQVRLARFYTDGIAMQGAVDFSRFESTASDGEGAVGDEVAGFFDLDIAF